MLYRTHCSDLNRYRVAIDIQIMMKKWNTKEKHQKKEYTALSEVRIKLLSNFCNNLSHSFYFIFMPSSFQRKHKEKHIWSRMDLSFISFFIFLLGFPHYGYIYFGSKKENWPNKKKNKALHLAVQMKEIKIYTVIESLDTLFQLWTNYQGVHSG